MKEATAFLRKVWRTSGLKQWLNRDSRSNAESTLQIQSPNMNMRSTAALNGYESMLVKMLRTVPISKRLETVSERDVYGRTLLHYAASSAGSLRVLKLLLEMYPAESECLRAVCTQDEDGKTVLHDAANSANPDMIRCILAALPKSQHLQVVSMEDGGGWNALHHAARSKNPEPTIKCIITLLTESLHTQSKCIQKRIGRIVLCAAADLNIPGLTTFIIALLPGPLIFQIVGEQDEDGGTVFHRAARSGNTETIKAVLDLYPESQHFQVLSLRDRQMRTILHEAMVDINQEFFDTVLSFHPESERVRALCLQDQIGKTALHYAIRSVDPRRILRALPKSQRLQAVCMQDGKGWTVLHYPVISINLVSQLTAFPEVERSQATNIRRILRALPKSQRLQAVCMQDERGWTVLHYAVISINLVLQILTALPESERSQAMNIRDTMGKTLLDYVTDDAHSKSIMEVLSPQASKSSKNNKRSLQAAVEEEVGVEQPEPKRQSC